MIASAGEPEEQRLDQGEALRQRRLAVVLELCGGAGHDEGREDVLDPRLHLVDVGAVLHDDADRVVLRRPIEELPRGVDVEEGQRRSRWQLRAVHVDDPDDGEVAERRLREGADLIAHGNVGPRGAGGVDDDLGVVRRRGAVPDEGVGHQRVDGRPVRAGGSFGDPEWDDRLAVRRDDHRRVLDARVDVGHALDVVDGRRQRVGHQVADLLEGRVEADRALDHHVGAFGADPREVGEAAVDAVQQREGAGEVGHAERDDERGQDDPSPLSEERRERHPVAAEASAAFLVLPRRDGLEESLARLGWGSEPIDRRDERRWLRGRGHERRVRAVGRRRWGRRRWSGEGAFLRTQPFEGQLLGVDLVADPEWRRPRDSSVAVRVAVHAGSRWVRVGGSDDSRPLEGRRVDVRDPGRQQRHARARGLVGLGGGGKPGRLATLGLGLGGAGLLGEVLGQVLGEQTTERLEHVVFLRFGLLCRVAVVHHVNLRSSARRQPVLSTFSA